MAKRSLYRILSRGVLFVHYLFFGIAWSLHQVLRFRPVRPVRKVLHISKISHKPFMISRVLRDRGIQADYLALGADGGRLDLGYDFAIKKTDPLWMQKLRVFYFVWFLLPRYDVLHYHFDSSLLPGGAEYDFMKALGKVLVFHYRGCDVRHRSLNTKLRPALNCCTFCDYPLGTCDTKKQLGWIEKSRRLGDLLFVTTPDLLDFVPEAEHLPFIAPYGFSAEGVVAAAKTPGVFRLVTSSNHHGIDGTIAVREATARLQAEGELVELIEVHETSFKEALSIYKSADLFVGKLRMGYYNNTNIELMMLGVPNISYIRDDLLLRAPDCPILVARPDNVYDKIKEILSDPQRLRELGERGPAFVQKYHSPQPIADRLIQKYEEKFRALQPS